MFGALILASGRATAQRGAWLTGVSARGVCLVGAAELELGLYVERQPRTELAREIGDAPDAARPERAYHGRARALEEDAAGEDRHLDAHRDARVIPRLDPQWQQTAKAQILQLPRQSLLLPGVCPGRVPRQRCVHLVAD
jgi:hypothetical protein